MLIIGGLMQADYRDIHTFAICTYHDSPYLEECLRSLVKQTVKSKMLISTSTPTESVRALAQKYDVELYIHDKGGSIGLDWNAAWEHVNTRFITIIHQDDVYMPRFLETNMKKMLSSNDAILSFTNYCEIDSKSTVKLRNRNLKIKDLMLLAMKMGTNSNFIRDRVLSMGSPICCPAVTYNKSMLEGFRFSDNVSATVDWDAFYRINKYKGKWFYTNETLMYHRIHSGSETSASIEKNERTIEELNMFKRYWPKPIAEKLINYYSKAQLTNKEENR